MEGLHALEDHFQTAPKSFRVGRETARLGQALGRGAGPVVTPLLPMARPPPTRQQVGSHSRGAQSHKHRPQQLLATASGDRFPSRRKMKLWEPHRPGLPPAQPPRASWVKPTPRKQRGSAMPSGASRLPRPAAAPLGPLSPPLTICLRLSLASQRRLQQRGARALLPGLGSRGAGVRRLRQPEFAGLAQAVPRGNCIALR